MINKRKYSLLISSLLVLSLLLTGCKTDSKDVLNENVNPSEHVSKDGDSQQIIEEETGLQSLGIKGIMEELTCDEYLSRKVGTDANIKSMEFIRNYFEAIGLEPFNSESYYQDIKANNLTRQIIDSIDNDKTVNNVIGVIKGEDSSKAVVISAHFDHITLLSQEELEKSISSIEAFTADGEKLQGAVDNASGVSTLLESAKELVEHYKTSKPPHDIIFAAFNAEEIGLVGSAAFVDEYAKNYEKWYNINIDCIGIKGDEGLALGNNNENSQELYDAFINVLDENNVMYENVPYARNKNGEITGTSDHIVFRQDNSSSMIIGQDGISEIVHSKDDNLDIIDFEFIENVKDAIVNFIIKSDSKVY